MTERAEAALSSSCATGDFLQCIYSVVEPGVDSDDYEHEELSVLIAITLANTKGLHTVSATSDTRHQKQFPWSSTMDQFMITIL